MSARSEALDAWTVARSAAGAIADPADAAYADLRWLPATVPGTVAGALRAAGEWSEDAPADLDADDWWFHTEFTAAAGAGLLQLDGLATVADVWLNGAHVLFSDDMFHAHEVRVDLAARNRLDVRFAALAPLLAGRGPRPRWKTRIVEHQRLRFLRTTLLGRMPGWTPLAPAVGPWRSVRVLAGDPPAVRLERMAATVGADGPMLHAIVHLAEVRDPAGVRLRVAGGEFHAAVSAAGDGWRAEVVAVTDGAERWYPHTHGRPALHDVTLVVDGVEHALGRVGFRSLQVDEGADGRGFGVVVNGVPVFCRGALWMSLDAVTLQATEAELRSALALVVAAGMNMVRVPGTTVYETDLFHTLCDEYGVMVWQDLMLANFDYPAGDEAFVGLVTTEVRQLARRLGMHPSTTVVCGGSEVEQQAAMMGVAAGDFPNALAREVVPAALADELADVPYVPCSPSGGVHPFSVDAGIGHYFGVGAYLRPLEDARRMSVRFASECLAFANVPPSTTVDELLPEGDRAPHSPRWKARVPRDRGAGWDFDDVRDHYVRECFGLDPMLVRYSDPERYLDLGRAAVVVAMEATVDEFRRVGSSCRGALVLMLRDLWHGAGWGVIDAAGRPKSAYFALSRANAPQAVRAFDEGLNGVALHLHNDRPQPLHTALEVTLFGVAGQVLDAARQDVTLDAHAGMVLSADAVLGAFRDLTHAYRFGPPSYDVLRARLLADDGSESSTAWFLPAGHGRPVEHDLGLRARVTVDGDTATLHVSTERFAQFVSIDAPGWLPADDWFHLAPGDERALELRPIAGVDPTGAAGWSVTAINTTLSSSVSQARTEGSR